MKGFLICISSFCFLWKCVLDEWGWKWRELRSWEPERSSLFQNYHWVVYVCGRKQFVKFSIFLLCIQLKWENSGNNFDIFDIWTTFPRVSPDLSRSQLSHFGSGLIFLFGTYAFFAQVSNFISSVVILVLLPLSSIPSATLHHIRRPLFLFDSPEDPEKETL